MKQSQRVNAGRKKSEISRSPPRLYLFSNRHAGDNSARSEKRISRSAVLKKIARRHRVSVARKNVPQSRPWACARVVRVLYDTLSFPEGVGRCSRRPEGAARRGQARYIVWPAVNKTRQCRGVSSVCIRVCACVCVCVLGLVSREEREREATGVHMFISRTPHK